MKHTLTILSFAALSFFFGCNKMETIQNPDGSITVIASVNVAQTKALASDGKKTFSVDDQLAVIYRQEGGGTAVAMSEKLTAGDIQRDGKYAKFHVTFTDPDKSELVTYVYPANMAKNDGTINYDALKNGQDGTLSKISSDLDLCTKDVSWSGSSLPDGTALENQLTVPCSYRQVASVLEVASPVMGISATTGRQARRIQITITLTMLSLVLTK